MVAASLMLLVSVCSLGLFTRVGLAACKGGRVEMLMVPSAAMGRDIPVAFHDGGAHRVVLLDAFNGGTDVSNWVGAGAFNTLAGKGISVAAPAGGAWSLYTNWDADGSKQWETFLADELPNWLAANKGLARDGHGVVCAAQGGTAALTLAAFHSGRYRYAGSLSGSLTPSRTARSRGSRAFWRREHPGHVGCRPTGSMEMARSRSRSRRGAAGLADAVSWILAGLRAAVTS